MLYEHASFINLGSLRPTLLIFYALAPVFCKSQGKPRRVYSRILAKVCAVAIAMGLVKNKA